MSRLFPAEVSVADPSMVQDPTSELRSVIDPSYTEIPWTVLWVMNTWPDEEKYV
jgi:hypothetical protein